MLCGVSRRRRGHGERGKAELCLFDLVALKEEMPRNNESIQFLAFICLTLWEVCMHGCLLRLFSCVSSLAGFLLGCVWPKHAVVVIVAVCVQIQH